MDRGRRFTLGFELVYAHAMRMWRKMIAKLMIIIVSRQQFGQLGAWLKPFKQLKPKKDRRDEPDEYDVL